MISTNSEEGVYLEEGARLGGPARGGSRLSAPGGADRAGGRRLERAKKRAAESLVLPVSGALEVDTLGEIGHEVDEFVQDRLQQGLATGTQCTYQLGWDR